MKRFLPFLLLLTLLCVGSAAAAFPPNGTVNVRVYNYTQGTYGPAQTLAVVTLVLDGEGMEAGETPAVILNGRTLAPLRWVAEQLGAKVEWVQGKSQVVEIGRAHV